MESPQAEDSVNSANGSLRMGFCLSRVLHVRADRLLERRRSISSDEAADQRALGVSLAVIPSPALPPMERRPMVIRSTWTSVVEPMVAGHGTVEHQISLKVDYAAGAVTWTATKVSGPGTGIFASSWILRDSSRPWFTLQGQT